MLRINSEIMDLIYDVDFEEDIKNILIKCLMLEAERYKTKYPRFTEDYDDCISQFIR